MTTLIAVYDGEGKCIGRCDARCYLAEHENCDCICHGRNHGVGFNQAVENCHELVSEVLGEFVDNGHSVTLEVYSEVQLELL